MRKFSKVFVGMDVHKESIDITVAEVDGEVRRWGEVGGDRTALAKAVRKLEALGKGLHFVYEAGPCGFWIERFIRARKHECWVVSPSLIPKKSGERIKIDRRDSEKIARMARAGELAPIYVPSEADEALRDLVRARDDARSLPSAEPVSSSRPCCYAMRYATRANRHGRRPTSAGWPN